MTVVCALKVVTEIVAPTHQNVHQCGFAHSISYDILQTLYAATSVFEFETKKRIESK